MHYVQYALRFGVILILFQLPASYHAAAIGKFHAVKVILHNDVAFVCVAFHRNWGSCSGRHACCARHVVGGTVCPAVAGELTAGLFACGEGGGAFGAKNFAQAIITNIDSSEATKMRSSGLRPFSFCGSLTNVSRP